MPLTPLHVNQNSKVWKKTPQINEFTFPDRPQKQKETTGPPKDT